jgi:hypothetical protein
MDEGSVRLEKSTFGIGRPRFWLRRKPPLDRLGAGFGFLKRAYTPRGPLMRLCLCNDLVLALPRQEWLVAIVISCCTLVVGSDDPPWEAFTLPGSGAEVQMPGVPKVTSRKIRPVADVETEVHLATARIKDGKVLLLFGYHDLTFNPADEANIRDILDGGVKGSLLNGLAKLTRHEEIKIDQFPGREFEYAGERFNQPIVGSSRIYLVGQRMYQITVLRAPEVDAPSEITRFLDSFRLKTAVESAPPVDPFKAGNSPADDGK